MYVDFVASEKTKIIPIKLEHEVFLTYTGL
jgi:hypothetical protein